VAEDEFLRTRDKEKIWQRYCGFLDLSINEFMQIQEHLLLEEIEMVLDSPLGQRIMKGAKPNNVDEFRKVVPMTTYADYAPYIGNRQEDALAVKPFCWTRTSGRGGMVKWVPYTQRCVDWIARLSIAMVMLACASRKGEIQVYNGMRLMHNLPPRPYLMGVAGWLLQQQFKSRMMPPFDEYEDQDFEKRIKDGFKMALRYGVDCAGSLTFVMLRMAEQFTERSREMKISQQLLRPQIAMRLLRATVRSKREKRNLLPKDLWPLKGLICYGMDTSIYRDKLIHYWGCEPFEMYGATETGLVAVTAWNKKWLTFFPFSCFLEFIPEEEAFKSQEDKDYTPPTILLDEVKAGERYELVITSFYGMQFLRYRLGDLLRIVDLQDEETGVKLPQMVFESRVDGIIDIGGFARLDEKTIWQAIANTGIKYSGWSARKEFTEHGPIVHIYMEPKDHTDANEIERRIHAELRATNKDYSEVEDMLNMRPLRVTILSEGSFQQYYQYRRKAGADLSHLKPPQINAPDSDIQELLGHARLSKEK